MYVRNILAISPFPVRVLNRHKGIIRLDGLRGKNFVPLDDDRDVFIEHPWCYWALYIHFAFTTQQPP